MPSYCYCPVSGALSFLLSELLSSASDLPLQRRLDHIPALLKVLERIVSGPRQGSMRERDVLQTGLNGCPSNRVEALYQPRHQANSVPEPSTAT